jgi:hypothetical protein
VTPTIFSILGSFLHTVICIIARIVPGRMVNRGRNYRFSEAIFLLINRL